MRSGFPTTRVLLAGCLVLLLAIAVNSILLASAAYARAHGPARADDAVSVSLFGLFHARKFVVTAPAGHALILHADEQSVVLENSGVSSATVRIDGSDLVVSAGRQELRSTKVAVAGRGNEPGDFILEIPSKIRRQYHGTLEIKPASGNLLSVVTLDLETAVASVVDAESAPDTPIEALKAQAICAFLFRRGPRSAP